MTRLFLCLLLLQSFNTAAAPVIQHWETSKGVPVYFVESHELPMIDIQLVFDAGSVRDPEGKQGLANLANGLISEAADGMSSDEISFEFESLGAEFSSSGGYDSASVSLRSLTDPAKLDRALDNLNTVISRPDFPEDVLERERNRLIVSLRQRQQSPRAISSDSFYEAVYGNHPYAVPNEGTAETLARIERQDLVDFHEQFYVTSNAMVSMVGDVDRTTAERIAEKITSNLKQGTRPTEFPQVMPLRQGQTVKINHPSTQTHIVIGQPGMKYGDPDYFSLYVGNHILGGGGLVSRLFEEVREKRGLSYAASSYFAPRRELGPFIASVQTREDQVDEALAVLKQTISDFVRHGPTEQELEAVKKNLTGGFPLRIDSNRNIAGYLSVIGFYGLPLDYLDRFIDNIESVSVNDIKDAFRRRISVDDFVVILVGPFETENQ
jgi:zinc protease